MKKILLAIAIIALCSGAFADNYNSSTKQITMNLAKGWNLIPLGFEGPDNISNNALAVYVWLPTLSKYIGGIVKDGSVQGKDSISDYSETMRQYAPGAFWVYLKKETTITSYAITEPKVLSGDGAGTKFARGWNTMTIWPYMVGINFNDLMGNCNITKANMWNSAEQKWGQTSSTQTASQMKSQNGALAINDVGKVIFLYAASDCEMGEAQALTPPPLPE